MLKASPYCLSSLLRFTTATATLALAFLVGLCEGLQRQHASQLDSLAEVSTESQDFHVGQGWDEYLNFPHSNPAEHFQRSVESDHSLGDVLPKQNSNTTENSLTVDLESYQASEPWHEWNSSDLVPVLPKAIAWLVYEAEQEYLNRTSGTGFDVKKTQTIAQYTSVAYCAPENISAWNNSRCQRAGDMQVYRVVFDPVWDLQAYAGYSNKLKSKVIVFRGTDSRSIYNWVENMHYWRTDLSVPFPNATGALVHTGFYVSYSLSTLRGNLTEAIVEMQKDHPNTPLYVSGHSLGSAMATICALDMKYNYNETDVRVYTFGSPRVGNLAFAKYFEASVQESWRMTHNRDLVPSVPLGIMGFQHVAREVWQVDYESHGVLAVCDSSGEDARCHNSMCYLGLCTSLADHLIYLGAHMHRTDMSC